MNIRKWFVLQILYFKRLFRKKSFLILLCLVPILVLGLRIVSTKDSGMVKIALCMENDDDELASKIVDRLLSEDSLITYEYCDDRNTAYSRIESGEVDAAWIFPEDMSEIIKEYASGNTSVQLVEIIEIEDTTSLKLSRESLMASFYDEIAYEEYASYVVKVVPEGTEVTEEELKLYYEYFRQDESLFEYYNIDGTEWNAGGGMLTAPIRGMLALLILLAGIAGVMYFRQDKESGVYDYLQPSEEWIYKLSGQLTAMIVIGIVSLTSLYISGNAGFLPNELLLIAEYIFACALFVALLDKLLGNLLLMGIVTPFVVLITFVMCPVFFSINGVMPVKCALPTFYYLMGTHDMRWVMYGGIYILAAFILNLIAEIVFVKGIRRNG